MATTRIVVNLAEGRGSYDVRLGKGLIESLGQEVRAVCAAQRALVITDSNVKPLYAGAAIKSLKAAGFSTIDITVPAGESSKSVECATEIWNAMAAQGLTRDCLVVALGGGVVGDLAGFVAATYMRGVGIVQVPTTLLAMVDSSVGGKTAVDLPSGKNLVGAFKQPLHVCASTDTLETLPESEWRCGCAEIAKSAVIDSDDFFFWLGENAHALAARDAGVATEAIGRSIVFKAGVVAADEKEEKGVRECLNYGHTLGHAIETLAGFGTFSHGEAVAEGMRFAARLSAGLQGASIEFVQAQDDLLDELGLPALDWVAEPDAVFDAMLRDKKSRAGKVRFVLPSDIGVWDVVEVDSSVILEHLRAWCASKDA